MKQSWYEHGANSYGACGWMPFGRSDWLYRTAVNFDGGIVLGLWAGRLAVRVKYAYINANCYQGGRQSLQNTFSLYSS